MGTRGRGNLGAGTQGRRDSGTWDVGRGDSGTCGRGDTFSKYRFQKWENIPKKVELLFCKNEQLYAFQVPAKYTAKF